MAEILGRITVNNRDILEVDADPAAGLGTVAPKASLAMFDSGTVGRLFIKIGAAATAWSQVDSEEGDDWNLDGNELTGVDALNPDQFFGSTNDFDVAFQRNNLEIMRLAQSGVLIGLNAALGGRLDIGVDNLGDVIMNLSSPNGGAGANVVYVHRQFKLQTVDNTNQVIGSIAVAEGQRIQARAVVVGNQHGGAGGTIGDGADYVRSISAKRLAGGNVLRNQRTTDFTAEDVQFFRSRWQENTVTNAIDLEVRGDTDRNIAWVAHVESMISTN